MATKYVRLVEAAGPPRGAFVTDVAVTSGLPGAGGGVASIRLLTDSRGKVVGGTWVDAAGAEHDIEVGTAKRAAGAPAE